MTTTTQQPVYKTLDERYVPERAIRAMARRVSNRRAWLGGKVDFAIAEYHMGAGRMARLLSAYFARTVKVSDVAAQMSVSGVSYPELFWTNTPYHRPAVYEALDDLNRVDYSPTYYFRVRQAMRLLEIYRESPEEYARLAALHQGRPGRPVLPSWQWSFVNDAGMLHRDPSERFVLLPDIAGTFGVRSRAHVMTGERSTIGSALFVAHQLRRLQGDRYTGFEISRMLAHNSAGDEKAGAERAAAGEDAGSAALHTAGWAFDVPSHGLSKTERRDLEFTLTDLRQAGLLAFVEEGKVPTYHVVRHPDHAATFEQYYWDVMAAGPVPAPDPPAHAMMLVPPAPPSLADVISERQVPRVFAALGNLFSRIYSYFA